MPPYVAFAVRPSPGYWEYVKVTADDLSVEAISTSDFLRFKELIFDEEWYVQPSRFIYPFLFIGKIDDWTRNFFSSNIITLPALFFLFLKFCGCSLIYSACLHKITKMSH